MPTVSSYTPAWLSRPSPGFDLFNHTPSNKSTNADASQAEVPGPLRTIALRGTEVFTVVGNELLWSDLVLLKERWAAAKEETRGRSGDDEQWEASYRVLRVPVSRRIRQIVVSPSGDYLAIITSHTIHVAVLPDSSHLSAPDMSELRLKTFHVGPTTHVVERSPIATALWHPLGVRGSCLVTVTADAVVRVWELQRDNRWSFDMPAAAVDLKKLANGRSTAEDFSPSKYGANKSFSPDVFEMEVASACFGGNGSRQESPWASMTLWIAMRAGDVYALCPLLPSKWQSPASLVESLSLSINCKAASLEDQKEVSNHERQAINAQSTWIDGVESQQHPGSQSKSPGNQAGIFSRPSKPSPIPKLQGPFRLAPDPDQILDITDIHVVASGVEENSDADDFAQPIDQDLQLSLGVVCLSTSDCKVHVCVDLNGVEGRWLPSTKLARSHDEESDEDDPELLVIESLSLADTQGTYWPVFSADVDSSKSVFVTHTYGVSHIDLSSFVKRLAGELESGIDSGAEFRIELVLQDAKTILDQPIRLQNRTGDASSSALDTAACVNLQDSDLGHFLLTVVAGQPYAVTLDETGSDRFADGDITDHDWEDEIQALITSESRPSYQPPKEFWSESTLSTFMDQHVHSRSRRSMSSEVRLSPSTLKLLMDAHRVLSHETHGLGVAAADLFSRCERLQDEFKEQIARVREAAERIDSLLNYDLDPYSANGESLEGTASEKLEERLETARSRQHALTQRYDDLRRKLGRLNGRPMGEKERSWALEIQATDGLLSDSHADTGDGAAEGDLSAQPKLSMRYSKLKRLKEQLVADAQEAEQHAAAAAVTSPQSPSSSSVALDRRVSRLAEIRTMLERQSALIGATKTKLERIGTWAQ